MELFVQPLGRTLSVEPGANLLETLREHKVPISYSCTAGRCGTCRCKVLEGKVLESGRESKITHPGDEGFVLACMCVLTEACMIEVPEPDEVITHPARVIKATVTAVENMTHDIRRLRLRPAKPLAFSAGQYASLEFATGLVRPYSMAGTCNDPELEFHVRLVPGGRVTGYIDTALKVGDAVRVSGPLGTAYLRKKYTGPMLCMAGGTGLAPVMSIVRDALASGMDNPIHVYVGARSPRDVYGKAWLDELAVSHRNLHVHIVAATAGGSHDYRSGLVTDAVQADWPALDGWRAYLCGTPDMVEAAAILVKKKGVLPEHVHADAFYPSGI